MHTLVTGSDEDGVGAEPIPRLPLISPRRGRVSPQRVMADAGRGGMPQVFSPCQLVPVIGFRARGARGARCSRGARGAQCTPFFLAISSRRGGTGTTTNAICHTFVTGRLQIFKYALSIFLYKIMQTDEAFDVHPLVYFLLLKTKHFSI